jgi:hypothetical protein
VANVREKTGWLQVYMTGGLVVVGLLAMIVTCVKMSDQVDVMRDQVKEMRKQSEAFQEVSNQAVRPFAVMSIDTTLRWGINYRIGPLKEAQGSLKTENVDVRDVIIGSHTDLAKTLVNIVVENMTVTITNTGRLPLYVTGLLASAKTLSEWIELDTSVVVLCDESAGMAEFRHLETDFVILPDSSRTLKPKSAVRTMQPVAFEQIRDSLHRFVVYPYIYLQYRDPFDRTYDALTMLAIPSLIDSARDSTGSLKTRINTDRLVIERYRWDVLIKQEQ